MSRVRGPVGVLTVALSMGLVTGILVTNVVLAVWTYRDAARRDLSRPGRWAIAVLVAGVFAFVPYVLVQRAVGWSVDSRLLAPIRWVARRYLGGVDDDAVPPGDADDEVTSVESTTDVTKEAAKEAATDAAKGAASEATREAAGRASDAATGAVERRVRSRRGGSLALTAARYGWTVARLGWKAVRLGGRGAVRVARRAAS